ncbi:MAG: hypothetical protein WCK83_16285 [Burkholderiales bacterium]
MDRREFVVKTAIGTGVLASAGCDQTINKASAAVALPPVPPDPRQFLTWDGGSGPDREYWSRKLLLPWRNPGKGDWLDAKQVRQGPLPVTSATVSGGTVALNVTDLVNRWITSGLNRGFYLRSTQPWAFTFAGRNYGSAGMHPRLSVVANGKTTDVPCTCNAAWTPSSFFGKDTRDSFLVAAGNQFAALQFDLSGVSAPVQTAMLVLTCIGLKYPGTLEVFELNPPDFRVGAGALKPQLGLAAAYLFDRGVASHPGVLFAGDFSDLSKARWQSGTVAAGSSQVADARTGSTYLRGVIPKGEVGGCDLLHNVVGANKEGVPDRVENELYARYYVYLEEDWGSEIDANKMPGWDGRFGWWNSVGYWQGTTGNGGARPTGLKVRNLKANRWEYQGASMRGHGGTRANDGNPYDDLFWVGNYIYHLDQASYFGEPMPWTGVVLGKGRWHCIEQYIKMNSIAGPFDAIGNGIAVSDGQYRAWLDGVQVFERTNLRWRRHAEMGVQGFWLNWYHGGTQPAPRDMHFRMDSVVVARAYIGPRNEG